MVASPDRVPIVEVGDKHDVGDNDVGDRPVRRPRQAGQACGIAEPPQALAGGTDGAPPAKLPTLHPAFLGAPGVRHAPSHDKTKAGTRSDIHRSPHDGTRWITTGSPRRTARPVGLMSRCAASRAAPVPPASGRTGLDAAEESHGREARGSSQSAGSRCHSSAVVR